MITKIIGLLELKINLNGMKRSYKRKQACSLLDMMLTRSVKRIISLVLRSVGILGSQYKKTQ